MTIFRSKTDNRPPVLSKSECGGFLLPLRIAMLLGCLLLWAPASMADDTAEKIYAAYQDNILQIRIVDRGSGSKSSIGSGFSVGGNGLIVTNYHVIAELISRPENYYAELVGNGGETDDLTLLAVDVVHDLAVLKLATPRDTYLQLAEARPVMGEELFSFGNPHDLGLTIVQGTYNGLLEKSLYEKIHFTASINPGMSGGPTLNRLGAVVGVNVSTAGNQISFLVPVSYVIDLLTKVPEEPPDAEALVASVRDQLLANQASYMATLQEAPFASVPIGNYQLPGKLAPFIKCWGDSKPNRDVLYEKVYQSCASSDDIYLSARQETGIIRFRHELFSTEDLNPIRFYNFLEKHINNPHLTLKGREESFTNYECRSDFVSHGEVDAKVIFCLRGYKKYEGLYDVFLTATTLLKNNEALHTTLSLAGVSNENAQRFAQTYLEAIQWKP
ncbi:MAG: trypsin-like peptidase domain-containing protein [Desulfuromonadales bacterium]|nr:trypsin-like peptidase domain-containing protein [Desulfuromonadales bacterium]